MTKWIRKDLEGFSPYNAAVPAHRLKLDANESPYTLTENVKKQFMDWVAERENFNIYPDSDSNELRETLAVFWNVPAVNIMCGVGSDQMIDYITKTFINPGDVAVVEKPTFSMYSLSTQINHGKIIEFNLNNEFFLDFRGIIELVNTEQAKILFLCTPNNPTGNSIDRETIEKIVSSVDSIVVVDEAYADFSGQSVIDLAQKYDNLIVIRTFSKAYGLAGARVGYAVACENIINDINIVKAPYNLNTISQKLALFALKDSAVYQKRVALLNESRAVFFAQLSLLEGIWIYHSEANFIYIESQKDIAADLKKEGVLVRDFGETGGLYKLRITCALKQQNDVAFAIIKQSLQA